MFGVDIAAFLAAEEYMEKQVDRACMYSIREAGRQIRSSARKQVPVLTGRLKKSISNSRRIRETGHHSFQLSVGPHGSPVFRYSGKIEALSPYMAPARSVIEGQMADIFAKAQAKVLARFA
ncbi:HK97 gp10 family phage protein [Nocardia sp. NPDC058058]|uniref:HK97 gp10 family phage protein n=1 Tax=Nocardia sp. NPDC058058 TaxID=3346317 RepID=UPI0036DF1226